MPRATPNPSTKPSSKIAAGRPAQAKAKGATKKSASKPKPKPTGALSRPAHVEVEVDRALKVRWDKAIATLSASKQKGATAFDVLWETVSEIVEHDPPLFLAGGFSTAKAFLAAHFEETERSAYRNMRVAKYASPTEEARYGVAKLDLALTYIEAKLGAPAKGSLPVDFARMKIPVERDGEEKKLGLEEVTAQEIAAAARKLARTAKKAPSKASPLVAAFTKALSKGPLRAVTVRLSNGKLSFGGVDPAAISAFSQALAGVKLPTP